LKGNKDHRCSTFNYGYTALYNLCRNLEKSPQMCVEIATSVEIKD